jgi:uncharacterized protein with ParB-like and HNH nuclease domain
MDAREFKVTDVLSRNERFVVPLYQRQYQWHDHRNYEGRTSAFWLDVVAKAEEVIEGTAKFDHYMGALLLAPETSSRAFGATPVVQVVDGQQRLTTFLILLAAMREVAREVGHSALIDQIEKYLFNEFGRADTDPLARFKVTPTPVDRTVFIDILEKPYDDIRKTHSNYYWGVAVPQNTPVRALRAYEYFIAQIKEFISSGVSDDTEVDIDQEIESSTRISDNEEDSLRRLESLLEALVFHLKLIVITLGPEDDAQVIFETLNSKGQPLLAMDLVRNNVFHRAEAQYRGQGDARSLAESLYHSVWRPFDDGWWRDNAPNARPARPRIDHFLANVLTAETGERITVRELYAEYRAWAMPDRQQRFPNVEDELKILQKHAPTYETLEGRIGGDSALMWLGKRLQLWQNTTVYPVAMQIALGGMELADRWSIVKWLDSYLARRILCDLTAKNLNQLFPRLAGALHREGVSKATVKRFFAGLTKDTTRFPNDEELKSGILNKVAYGRIPSRILSDLLWSLELSSRSNKTEATPRPASLWVEHIMPQSWQENWSLKETMPGDEDTLSVAHTNRQAAIQTFGNLTIITDRLNIDLGNSSFSIKAPKLVEHSNLTLNRKITEFSAWDEEAIKKRGETLAALAIDIWPSPF